MRKLWLLILAIIMLIGCSGMLITHDPVKAGYCAQYYADSAFVKRNIAESYLMLDESIQKDTTKEQYESVLAKLHPNGYPSSIYLLDYEPIPGQAAMNVYLAGTNATEQFYYKLLIKGSSNTNYHIGGLYRNNAPFPNTQLRVKFKDLASH